MPLNSAQTSAVQWIINNPTLSALITGGAGTGKSHVLREVLDELERHKVRTVHVTAPTGIAAVNVFGVTLYKFLGLQAGFEAMTPDQVVEYGKKFIKDPKWYAKRKTLEKVHTLVIDEISMLHAKFFRNMDTLLRIIKGRSREPFGGIRLIMVGDFLQLPPVEKGRNLDEAEPLFAFETENWVALNPHIFVLEDSFRQADDQRFFRLLKEIRWGVISEESKQLLKEYVRTLPVELGDKPRMTLMPKNLDVDRINKEHIDAIQEPLMTFKGIDMGQAHLLREIRALPQIELKTGAQVMLLKNITIKRPKVLDLMDVDDDAPDADILPNGAIGRVESFEGGTETSVGTPVVAFPTIGALAAHSRKIHMAQFDIVEVMGEKPLATRLQYPLIASYAMSIHKAQGQTIACPIITSTKEIFAAGQFYVLLSRAKSIDQLYLEDLDTSKIYAHPKAVAFMKTIETMPEIR